MIKFKIFNSTLYNIVLCTDFKSLKLIQERPIPIFYDVKEFFSLEHAKNWLIAVKKESPYRVCVVAYIQPTKRFPFSKWLTGEVLND